MTIDEFIEQLRAKKYKFKVTPNSKIRCNGCCPIEALSGCTVWEGSQRLGLDIRERDIIMLAADYSNYIGRYGEVNLTRDKLLTLVEEEV